MRLSLWTQFSSNHSAWFTLVGIFPTADKAREVAETWRQLIKRVETWMADNPNKLPDSDEDRQPLEIEQQLAREYQLLWDVRVEWWADLKVEIELERFVTINPQFGVSFGPEPLDQLMRRLGGQPLVVGTGVTVPFGKLDGRIFCTSPNAETINTLIARLTISEPSEAEIKVKAAHNLQLIVDFECEVFGYFVDILQQLHAHQCTNIELNMVNRRYTELDILKL